MMMKWLVCAGPAEYLYIAAALVAAGVCEIEWQTSPFSTRKRAEEIGLKVTMGIVVGEGLTRCSSHEAAVMLAEQHEGSCVLCAHGAGALAAEMAAHTVTAAVEPGALPRVVASVMGRELQGVAALAYTPFEEGLRAGEEQQVVLDLEEPLQPSGSPEMQTSRETQGFPVSGAAHGASLRPAGRLPREGISKDVPSARTLSELLAVPAPESTRNGNLADRVAPAVPAGDGRAAPAMSAEASAPQGESAEQADVPLVTPEGLPTVVRTEPVVYRPVVTIGQPERGAPTDEHHVPTVCFASARGGVGKSSLAVLTALSLARDGLSVALIDLDFQFGTCLGFVGADETDGVLDMGAVPEHVCIDARMLARCRTSPVPGLSAYEFCRAPEQAEILSGMAGELLKAARAGADVAVVDLPCGVNETVVQAFDLADRCLFVTDQRAFALESVKAQQELCIRMGVTRTKLLTVINRCDPRHRDESFLTRAGFEVKTPQVMRVYEGGSEVMQMLTLGKAGELIAMRNRFALSASDFAHTVCADLGCYANDYDFAPTAQAAAPHGQQSGTREGVLHRKRKERQGEQVPCPF